MTLGGVEVAWGVTDLTHTHACPLARIVLCLIGPVREQTGDSEERMEWESGGDRTAAASSEEEGEGAAPRHQRRQTLFSPMLSGGFGADVAEPPAMATAMVRRPPNEPSWVSARLVWSGSSFYLMTGCEQGCSLLGIDSDL